MALTFTGGEDTTFSKETITSKSGLIAPNAIVELPHMHIFIGHDNVYMFDGNTCEPIGDQVKTIVLQKIKPESYDSIFGYYNEESGDISFSFCSVEGKTGDCDMAITYNLSQRTWSTR